MAIPTQVGLPRQKFWHSIWEMLSLYDQSRPPSLKTSKLVVQYLCAASKGQEPIWKKNVFVILHIGKRHTNIIYNTVAIYLLIRNLPQGSQLPPQSTPVSSPFSIPSLQVTESCNVQIWFWLNYDISRINIQKNWIYKPTNAFPISGWKAWTIFSFGFINTFVSVTPIRFASSVVYFINITMGTRIV